MAGVRPGRARRCLAELADGESDKEVGVQMAVYDVAFAHGWKPCGFTRDGDGRIDSVECR